MRQTESAQSGQRCRMLWTNWTRFKQHRKNKNKTKQRSSPRGPRAVVKDVPWLHWLFIPLQQKLELILPKCSNSYRESWIHQRLQRHLVSELASRRRLDQRLFFSPITNKELHWNCYKWNLYLWIFKVLFRNKILTELCCADTRLKRKT